MAPNNFSTCLKHVLTHEGGYVNHPEDPGGMTNLGVTKRTLEGYLGKSVDEAAMRSLKQSNVEPIYKKNYWDLMGCEGLSPGVDLMVFDFGVNAGPSRALRMLAECSEGETTQFIKEYAIRRRSYYRSLAKFKTFGKGWLRRVDAVEKTALEMVK